MAGKEPDEATLLWGKIADLSHRERELLERLAALVGVIGAHVELFPAAYESPAGRMLVQMAQEEGARLMRETRRRP